MFGLGRLLWKQGIAWFLLATVADVPTVVLICLDLNDPLSLISITPSLVMVSIAATRMYRSLVDFVYGSTYIAQDSLQENGSPLSKVTRITAAHIPLKRLEVAVHTVADQYPTSQTSRHGSYIGMDRQGLYPPSTSTPETDPEA